MWWFFLLLFIGLLIYLLLMPIVFYIDTGRNEYRAQVGEIVKFNIESHQTKILRIRARFLFMKFYFYPLQKSFKKKKKRKEIEGKTSRKSKIGFKKVIKLLGTFQIKKFHLDLDTGNYVLNGKLYAIVGLVNYKIGRLSINFQGRNRMVLDIRNRPIRMIKVFINV